MRGYSNPAGCSTPMLAKKRLPIPRENQQVSPRFSQK
jgi:hypothetical protein